MDLVLSDDLSSSELGQSLGRLVNAIVAVLGPELSPTSSFFMRCKVHIVLLSTVTTGSYVLDWVIFAVVLKDQECCLQCLSLIFF
jgi:hypothetical protein